MRTGPEGKADAQRPVRLAVIQLGTYDGTIDNARQVVGRIGGPASHRPRRSTRRTRTSRISNATSAMIASTTRS